MMQDIILARVWSDHHQRVYGDSDQVPDSGKARSKADSLPIVAKAMMLALAASMASLGSSLATVAIA